MIVHPTVQYIIKVNDKSKIAECEQLAVVPTDCISERTVY